MRGVGMEDRATTGTTRTRLSKRAAAMNGITRRILATRALLAATLALSLLVPSLPVAAQTTDAYPAKPIRVVVPFPPGGAVDLFARRIGDRMRDALGQPIIVDNRPGANTLPIEMFLYLQKWQDPTIAALSVVLILFAGVLVAMLGAVLRNRQQALSLLRRQGEEPA